MSPAPLDRVLMIDDSALDNRMHARVIARSGLVRTLLSDTLAEDALARLGQDGGLALDLILLDINMPRMDGFEFLEAAVDTFGAAFAAVPVVMLSTSLNPRDRARAEGLAMVAGYVEKPLSADAFSEIVHRLAGAPPAPGLGPAGGVARSSSPGGV